jgi:hypothetical protein
MPCLYGISIIAVSIQHTAIQELAFCAVFQCVTGRHYCSLPSRSSNPLPTAKNRQIPKLGHRPNVETVETEARPNYIAKISPSEANKACRKLQDGLIEICMRDPTMNDSKVEARKAAIDSHLRKSIAGSL